MKSIRFTQHALDKLDVLAAHGFDISQDVVIETIQFPDKVEKDKTPPIAQRKISDNTVLRVVYTETSDEILIITFYPGERRRYED